MFGNGTLRLLTELADMAEITDEHLQIIMGIMMSVQIAKNDVNPAFFVLKQDSLILDLPTSFRGLLTFVKLH